MVMMMMIMVMLIMTMMVMGDDNAVVDDIDNVGCTEFSKKRVREYAICPQAFRPDPRLEIECYYVGT